MNRKVKSFKQCFYRNNVRCQKLQVFEAQSFNFDTGPQSFCYSFVAMSIIRFQVSQEIRCSSVKLLLLLWKPSSWF